MVPEGGTVAEYIPSAAWAAPTRPRAAVAMAMRRDLKITFCFMVVWFVGRTGASPMSYCSEHHLRSKVPPHGELPEITRLPREPGFCPGVARRSQFFKTRAPTCQSPAVG